MELISEDISYFFRCVLKLIDRGYYESIQTTAQHIEDEDVVQWLVERYSEKEQLFQEFAKQDCTALNHTIKVFGSDSSANPILITNNGLCLLLDIVFKFTNKKSDDTLEPAL